MGKHLKEYKKEYRKSITSKVKTNKDWKKRWLPFIKYDHDFDGGFLIDLIVHKLHIMLDFYEDGKHCWQVDESRLEIVESLKEACRLGDMIIADEFGKEAFDVLEKHMHISSEPENDGLHRLDIRWDSPEAGALYNELTNKADELREKTIDKFFEYIRNHYNEWWD